MEIEIALLIQFLHFVHLDSIVMEMETVFKAHHHFQKFVQIDPQLHSFKYAKVSFQNIRISFASSSEIFSISLEWKTRPMSKFYNFNFLL